MKRRFTPASGRGGPAADGQYSRPHTWPGRRRSASFDGFVFVTPEYNPHLRRAEERIDFLYAEWNNKAAGFVSYG